MSNTNSNSNRTPEKGRSDPSPRANSPFPTLRFVQNIWGKSPSTSKPTVDEYTDTPPVTPDSSPTYNRATMFRRTPSAQLSEEAKELEHEYRRNSAFMEQQQQPQQKQQQQSAYYAGSFPVHTGLAHTRAVSLPDTHSIEVAAAAVVTAETLQVHSTSTASRKLRSRRRSTVKNTKGTALQKRRRRRVSDSDEDQSITSDSEMSSMSPPRVIDKRRRKKTDVRWYHCVWRLSNSSGLVWLLGFVACVSITSMYMANRALARRNSNWRSVVVPQGPSKVLFHSKAPVRTVRTVQVKPRAGLRGKVMRRFSKTKLPDTTKQSKEEDRSSSHFKVLPRLVQDASHGVLPEEQLVQKDNQPHHHQHSVHKHDHDHDHDHTEHKEQHHGHHHQEETTKHSDHKKSTDKKKPPKKDVGMFKLLTPHKPPLVKFAVPEILMPKAIPQEASGGMQMSGVVLPTAPFKRESTEYDRADWRMYAASKSNDSAESEQKRVVFIDSSMEGIPVRHRALDLYPADYTDPTQLYPILDSSDERVRLMEPREPYVQGECVPMQQWQTTYHPSCNRVHETSINNILGSDSTGEDMNLFGTKGFWRNAWRVELLGGGHELTSHDKFVMKTLKLEHNFEEAHFEHDRIDAVAMERLTASPHVIDVFGFCGHTVMTEFADGKRLGQLADKAAEKPLERLKIARDIAQGLADVHGIDGDGNTTFVHLDINPANVVSVGGRLKLNDFNIGIPRKWNTTSQKPCGFPTQYPNPQWRSPEEARNEQHLTEKVDIFSFAHILFRLICGHEPWNKFEPARPTKEELTQKVARGIMPTIPPHVLKSKDPEVVSILRIMIRCYSLKPADRPSAREIATALDTAVNHAEKFLEAKKELRS